MEFKLLQRELIVTVEDFIRRKPSLRSAGLECELLYKIGWYLNNIETHFKSKYKFTDWRKSVFNNHHIRTLQQAQQLNKFDSLVKTIFGIGKTRTIAICTLINLNNSLSLPYILKTFPFKNKNEEEMKEHADMIISFYRLKYCGSVIDSIKFDEVQELFSLKGSRVTVDEAITIKEIVLIEPGKNLLKLYREYFHGN